MESWYDYRLVGLSLLIAVFASFAALDLAGRTAAARGGARRAWLAGGATAMGMGIWSMHYIGMLAFHLPAPVLYDLPTVFLSLLAAIFSSAIALLAVSRTGLTKLQAVAGSVVMGSGIATMHYIGMAAMRLRAECHYSVTLVALSVVIAIVVSLVALWLAFHFRKEVRGISWAKVSSAVVMGIAICSMHYTGMAAARFTASDLAPNTAYAVGISTLGTADITLVTLMVLGLAVLSSMVDRRFSAQTLELEASELRYRQLFERSLAGVFRSTLDGRILAANEACARILGFGSSAELLSARADQLYLDLRDRQTLIRRLEEEKSLTNLESQLRRKDGSAVWVLENATLTEDADGSGKVIEGTLADITERKEAEETLARERNLLRTLIDTLPEFVYAKDTESRFLMANRPVAQAMGARSPAELTGKTDFEFYPREMADKFCADEREVLRTGSAVLDREEPGRKSDGTPAWILTSKVPFRNAGGEIVGIVGVGHDITDRKRTEEELRKANQELAHERTLFNALMDSIPDTIYFQDAACRFMRINQAQAKMLGIQDPKEAIGKTDFDYFPAETAQGFYDGERKLLQSGQPIVDGIQKVTKADGQVQWLSATEVPIRDAHGKVTGFVGISRDITDRKLAEVELQKAKESAEAANRAKSEFLANMSHEIRTPMNGIIGMTELALDTPLSSEQREYLTMVKDSAESLLTLINDILDFSKIEAGKLALDLVEFNLHDVITNALRSLSVRASQKGVELAWGAKRGVPERLTGDAGRVRQILVNLVGNAIKFTERGEVVVSVEVESQNAQDMLLKFTVRDTGIGIAPEKQRAIFEAFTQADSSMTRKYGGTGLGLTISQRLVQLMGGRIWLESTPGEGSTFHFTARLGPARDAASEAPTREVVSLRDLPVLVVDDNKTNRKILDAMLKHWLMRPELAESGEEGLSALDRAASSGTPFPLVLLDAQMPQMDGFSLAERIKQNPKFSGAVIMMLTSAGQRGDAARCRELGIAVYLIKPIRQSELLEAILAAVGKPPGAREPRTVITRHSLRENRRRLEILLAEDNAINQQLAMRLLEKRGHTVTVASNGEEALVQLKRARFDLVLMDVQMPVMDGLQATAAIRKEEETTGRHIPVIAMTAHAMEGDRERCLRGGMDAYISKPIQADELTVMVEEIVQLGSVMPVEAKGAPPTRSGAPHAAALDRAEALNRVRGDEELLAELVELFLKDYPKQLVEIQSSIEQEDSERLERAAHSFKGSASNFGARRACDLAAELEQKALTGDLENCRRLHAALEGEMASLRPELLRLGKIAA